MGRKAVDLNPEMGKRLSEWLDDIKMTQTELADRIKYTQQYISKIVNGKQNISSDLAKLISEKAPKPCYNIYGELIGEEHVTPQWLLCLDDSKTDYDRAEFYTERREYIFNCLWAVLDESARKRGAKIVLQHPLPEKPSYLEQLNSQKDKCKYIIQKDGTTIREFSVVDFIKLTQQLEKYSDFIIWQQSDSGTP